jgi:hypothetical protein
MPDFTVPVLIIAVGVGLSLYRHFATLSKEADRRELLDRLVSELGLDYEPNLDPSDFELFQRFGLAGEGHSRVSSNAIVADSGALRMVMFDHRYTAGGRQRAIFHRQVVIGTADDLKLPNFRLSSDPRRSAATFSKLLGLNVNDIDFNDDPEFSKRFLLKGSDEKAVRDYFTRQRRAAFMQFPYSTWTVLECNAHGFLFYKPRCEFDLEQIKALMNQAFFLYQILREDEPTALLLAAKP